METFEPCDIAEMSLQRRLIIDCSDLMLPYPSVLFVQLLSRRPGLLLPTGMAGVLAIVCPLTMPVEHMDLLLYPARLVCPVTREPPLPPDPKLIFSMLRLISPRMAGLLVARMRLSALSLFARRLDKLFGP